MPQLILLRQSQSICNLENKFTGELDVNLSQLGKHEAMLAAVLLVGIYYDLVYTSVLK